MRVNKKLKQSVITTLRKKVGQSSSRLILFGIREKLPRRRKHLRNSISRPILLETVHFLLKKKHLEKSIKISVPINSASSMAKVTATGPKQE